MLQTILSELGFTKKETLIYLTVLQQGKVSLTDIAVITGVNRTTVYAVAKELLKKGVIREEIGKKTYLIACPPEDLHNFIEHDRTALNRKEHLVQSAITELLPFAKNMRYDVPRLSFIDEDQLEQHLRKESERWTQSVRETGGMWVGFQDHSFAEEYEDWIDWYWTRKFTKDTELQLFTNDSDIEGKMKKKQFTRRRMKHWESQNEITSTLWVAGEFVIMIVTRTRPHYLVEIHDKLLSRNLHEVFQKLWLTS